MNPITVIAKLSTVPSVEVTEVPEGGIADPSNERGCTIM
jgi:hypothetical protein